MGPWHSISLAAFDRQHQTLFGLINEIHQAIRQDREREVVDRVIEALDKFSAQHFADEERLFEIHGFPEGALHKTAHENFQSKIADIRSAHNQGGFPLGLEVPMFLKLWHQNHILSLDRRFGKFIAERGAKNEATIDNKSDKIDV
jgi:hemerythrin